MMPGWLLQEGVRFLSVVQRTEDHLNACCKKVEEDLADDSLSEEGQSTELLCNLSIRLSSITLLCIKHVKDLQDLKGRNTYIYI